MYRARNTLLLKFENDALDESVDIERVLKEANTIMRMKRPMVEMQVQLKVLQGTHLTPLTQNIILDPPESLLGPGFSSFDVLKSLRAETRENFLRTVNDVKNEILGFLEKSIRQPQSFTASSPTTTDPNP